MEIMTITPGLAKKWLSANTANRSISKQTRDSYASAIKRGEWKLNGECIKFAKDGRLLDGQHRLHAVVLADMPIQSYVIRGLDDSAFITLDTGKKRSAADVLSISGEKNQAVLAAATRAYIYLVEKNFSGTKISNSLIVSTIEEAPHLRYWASLYSNGKAKAFLTSAFPGACAFYAERHGSDVILSFFYKVETGVGLKQDDPAYQLREKFINRGRGVQFNIQTVLAYCCKALNAHVTGKPMKMIRLKTDESFPEYA